MARAMLASASGVPPALPANKEKFIMKRPIAAVVVFVLGSLSLCQLVQAGTRNAVEKARGENVTFDTSDSRRDWSGQARKSVPTPNYDLMNSMRSYSYQPAPMAPAPLAGATAARAPCRKRAGTSCPRGF